MMRGPSYDDSYISRKLTSFQSQPSFVPPPPPSYGRYMQETVSVSPTRKYHQPSSRTQLILNRVSLTRPTVRTVVRGYPPVGLPRLPPRMVPVPSYYDYDYPYAGGYGGYTSYLPPPIPRMSRYDAYLDDDLDVAYQPRYRPRAADTLEAMDSREKSTRDPALSSSTHTTTSTTTKTNTDLHPYTYSREPAMLQDHVDKMRIRLKSLAYSLDPTGPVPEIVIPSRSKRSESAEPSKKYSMGLDYSEVPRLSYRKQRYYPEDDHMKDNLRIKCLSHYKTTRNAAGYCKAKQYVGGEVLPETYTGSYKPKYSSTKWEEPDTVYSGPSDKKPYSKAITDASTEDAKAEDEPKEEKKERRKKKKSKERDEAPAAEASADATPAAPAASAAPAAESESAAAPSEEAPKADAESAAPAPAAADAPTAEEEVLDEKERKKLEKKRRKAEREAAAKAAMEAELAALAAAEAELARLEAESASIKVDAAPAEPAAPAEAAPAAATTEAAPEAKSESAADKCKSPIVLESEVEPQVASECPAAQVELESSAEKPVECVPQSPLQEPQAFLMDQDQTQEPYAMPSMTTQEDIEAFLQQEAAGQEEPAAPVAGQEEAATAQGEVGAPSGEVDAEAEAAAQIGAATDDVTAEAAGGDSTDQPDHVPLQSTTITPTTTTATTPPPGADRVEGEQDA